MFFYGNDAPLMSTSQDKLLQPHVVLDKHVNLLCSCYAFESNLQ